MSHYVSKQTVIYAFVDLLDRDVQNVQERSVVWGEIRAEFDEHRAD